MSPGEHQHPLDAKGRVILPALYHALGGWHIYHRERVPLHGGALIAGLDRAYPGAPKFGGLASGGRGPGENRLLLGREMHRTGVAGVAFSGNVAVETVVAQGCRPIGEPMFVTACDRNVIRALDGQPPLAVLRELHDKLQPRDRQLARHSLFLGIVMKEDRQQYGQGDFLIRNLIGIDLLKDRRRTNRSVQPAGKRQQFCFDSCPGWTIGISNYDETGGLAFEEGPAISIRDKDSRRKISICD